MPSMGARQVRASQVHELPRNRKLYSVRSGVTIPCSTPCQGTAPTHSKGGKEHRKYLKTLPHHRVAPPRMFRPPRPSAPHAPTYQSPHSLPNSPPHHTEAPPEPPLPTPPSPKGQGSEPFSDASQGGSGGEGGVTLVWRGGSLCRRKKGFAGHVLLQEIQRMPGACVGL
jgi:hypothetical protein